MIAKLRIKLIAAAMISLSAVLIVILGTISCLNYQKIVSDADSTLSILAENGGFFPQQMGQAIPYKEMPPQKKNGFSPELPFETRYFFVTLNMDGDVFAVNTGKIAAVDTSTAIEYAQHVQNEGTTHGFLGNYRYLVSPQSAGSLILFLDCGRSLDNFRTLLMNSVLVSLTGSLFVLLLLILLSRRIVKPFSENYEKQKRFITDAGHELKTPLTIIDANTEILTMDLGENEWVHNIQTQTKRLSDLTNDLILLSRMEETGHTGQQLEFPLSDVVEETIQSFLTVAQTQEKTVCLDIEPMLSFNGDEKSIRKLISILLDNAIKYTPSQGTIICTLARQKKQICFSISNTVESISKEQIGHLFDRFYRTDSSRNSQTGGYGLGLSIAQAIVTAHKGKITAFTKDGHSLTFTVTLPVSFYS